MTEEKIVTEELVILALNLARPTIEKILKNPFCIWGPQWVDVIFEIPDHFIKVADTVGEVLARHRLAPRPDRAHQ